MKCEIKNSGSDELYVRRTDGSFDKVSPGESKIVDAATVGPAPAQIDAGADALRQRQMAGRITRPWTDLPTSDKRKWREHAEAVLRAAAQTSE